MPIITEELESMGALLHPGKHRSEGCLPDRTIGQRQAKLVWKSSARTTGCNLQGATHNQSIFIAEIKLAGIVRSGKTYK